jgi:hypothetical protein
LNKKHRFELVINVFRGFLSILAIVVLPVAGPSNPFHSIKASDSPLTRRVNVPYLGKQPPVDNFIPAIFWFGKVDPTDNYADVRVYYYDDYLKVVVHVIDRLLWEDDIQNASTISQWDAISLYMNLQGNSGNAPTTNSYRFDVELNNLQGTYKGNGSDWITTSIPISTTTDWRGEYGPNSNQDSKGWIAYFQIPFSSLGLSIKPATGTVWGFAVAMHDRDNANGSILNNTFWPETMDASVPATWGQLHFGEDTAPTLPSFATNILKIQNGLDGGIVKDADVGGHTTCGSQVDHWTQWGYANYAGYTQINIQNQWDISDWPCFSKYYITFSLDSLPKGLKIVSASVTMYLTGTAGGGQWGPPPNSYIQAFTVGEDWNEATINWNNAPLAVENISGAWVYPSNDWPAYSWDVSRAVMDANKTGTPLRLAFYSADGDYHTGKYFSSSDWEPDVGARPFLSVVLSTPCNSPGINCTFNYLPLTIK